MKGNKKPKHKAFLKTTKTQQDSQTSSKSVPKKKKKMEKQKEGIWGWGGRQWLLNNKCTLVKCMKGSDR